MENSTVAYIAIGATLSAILLINCLLIYSFSRNSGNSSEGSPSGGEQSTVGDSLPSSWSKVANCWLKVNNLQPKDSPQWYESRAEYYRCLANADINIKYWKNWHNASKNYEKAERAYSQAYHKSNSATDAGKSVEMNAKVHECYLEEKKDPNWERRYACGLAWVKGVGAVSWSSPYAAGKAWEKLASVFPPYAAYARAKCFHVRGLWEEAAQAWGETADDERLKEVFSSDNHWLAFKAYAEANRLEALLKCGKANKQETSEAWHKVYENYKKCNNARSDAWAEEAKLKYRLLSQ